MLNQVRDSTQAKDKANITVPATSTKPISRLSKLWPPDTTSPFRKLAYVGSHHSQLKYGDGILIGVSSVDHVKENLADLDKGPLPEEVVAVIRKLGGPC
ncbi:hypothetical protein BDP27DRAFT_1443382 [Rhodocollybia butyracea]|uniref:Uncharacterized protein n=1 Tax=Rhodocollybia butyracea TaxID=206335 RepID=A0A9P5UDS8_9AGAR|nr:hypothetical protein BDP27DRAFT_1443382 [Rhodocollybia butyracea]